MVVAGGSRTAVESQSNYGRVVVVTSDVKRSQNAEPKAKAKAEATIRDILVLKLISVLVFILFSFL